MPPLMLRIHLAGNFYTRHASAVLQLSEQLALDCRTTAHRHVDHASLAGLPATLYSKAKVPKRMRVPSRRQSAVDLCSDLFLDLF